MGIEKKYFRLTDLENFGKIVKAVVKDDNPPRAFVYDKNIEDWKLIGGFFFNYMIPEEDNKYEMFEELSEKEVKPYLSNFVSIAHEIAREAHKGQTDKGGTNYIEHPEYVASLVNNEEEKATAYLHDTLEDTAVTINDLLDAGIPKSVVEAVDILTKKKNEDYFIYLKKVKNNPIARLVKLADLKHNSDLTRLENIDVEDMKRIAKYREAQLFLVDKE